LQISDGDHHGSWVISASLARTETPAPNMPWMRGRDPAAEGWRWVRTAPEAIELLASGSVLEATRCEGQRDLESFTRAR
jgi:hypothetical protein